MAYTELINQIKAAIKNNGVQLITGDLLQTQLLDMIEEFDLDITAIQQAITEINEAIGEVSTDYLPVTLKGAANGLAELDSTGIVKSSQLPTQQDEVLEYDDLASFPAIGEGGKIYMAKNSNMTYRWGGTAYAPLNAGVGLGETSETAFRGDHGKIAYDHSQITAGTGVHISATERTNWNAAFTDKHTHSNKSVLDGITSGRVTAWDSAATNSHAHDNKAALDSITAAKIINWDTAHGWGNHASAGYALASSLDNYLLKTGGTLEGASESLLALNNTTPSASSSYINYKAGGVSKALIGYLGAHGAAIQNVQTGALLGIVGATGQPYYAANATADKNTLFHQGNANNPSTDWTAKELISEKLRIPSAPPTGMTAGKWYMTMADTGWSAELPGGGTGGVTSLWLLDETSLVGSPSNNQALVYNQTTSKWSNATLMIAHIDGLQAALNGKEAAITTGTAAQYIRGDKTLGTMPTSLPASDVYAWAKAATKPSYSFSEITGKPSTYTPSAHTHTKADITDFAHTHDYAASDHNHNDLYLKLEGGEVTGSLTLKNAKFNKTLLSSPNATDDILNVRRYGLNHTILNIMAPPQTSWGKAKEATLALVRGDNNEYFLDLYNMDYGSVDAGNYLDYGNPKMGLRMQKRRTGVYTLFSFEYGDGTNVLPVMQLYPSTSSGSTNNSFVSIINRLAIGYGNESKPQALAVNGSGHFNTTLQVAVSITSPTITASTELIAARLRIPKLTGAPTGLTSGEWYQFMV